MYHSSFLFFLFSTPFYPFIPRVSHGIDFTIFYLTWLVLQAQSILGWSPIEFDATLETRIMPVFEGNGEPTAYWNSLRKFFYVHLSTAYTYISTSHDTTLRDIALYRNTSHISMLSLMSLMLRCSLYMMTSRFSSHVYTLYCQSYLL